jgi:hypothetical protein
VTDTVEKVLRDERPDLLRAASALDAFGRGDHVTEVNLLGGLPDGGCRIAEKVLAREIDR